MGSEYHSEGISENLRNIADHIYEQENERETQHVSEIRGIEKGDLVVVTDKGKCVIETNVGWVDKMRVEVGDKVKIN